MIHNHLVYLNEVVKGQSAIFIFVVVLRVPKSLGIINDFADHIRIGFH